MKIFWSEKMSALKIDRSFNKLFHELTILNSFHNYSQNLNHLHQKIMTDAKEKST